MEIDAEFSILLVGAIAVLIAVAAVVLRDEVGCGAAASGGASGRA